MTKEKKEEEAKKNKMISELLRLQRRYQLVIVKPLDLVKIKAS